MIEVFEKWCKKKHPSLNLNKGDGGYTLDVTSLVYEAFLEGYRDGHIDGWYYCQANFD